jgi:hypothetical protein
MLRAAFDVPDDQFAELIRRKLEDEPVRDALLEAMRAALEAMSDDVMPALGGLIREYAKVDRRADGFFRGCCRLLQDVSAEEYQALRLIVNGIAKRYADKRYAVFREAAVRLRGDYARSRRDHDNGDHGGIVVGDFISTKVPDCPREQAMRLFHLLAINGLATEIPRSLSKPRVDRNGNFRPLEYEKSELAIDVPTQISLKLVEVIPGN